MHVVVFGLFQVTLLFCVRFAFAENSKNCAEIKLKGDATSGVRAIYPFEGLSKIVSVDVFCDQVTDEGGWTVIQNRDAVPVRENFFRPWDEYVQGFGDLKGEFWLGLEYLHALTSTAKMELRVDLEDFEGEKRWAKYGTFKVGNSESKYVLTIGDYTGDAGEGFTPADTASVNLNGMKFSTHDQDNDLKPSGNCAKIFKGAWWFNDCHRSHLNGLFDKGIIWFPFGEGGFRPLKKVSMKIRPAPIKVKNCAEIKSKGDSTSGVRTVNPYGDVNSRSVEVYCDQTSDGGGWTVFQSRSPLPTRETFTRSWKEYVEGFGDVNGEFWLGLENIHAFTNSVQMELRIDLEDWEGERRWAKYGIFHVGDSASKYVLRIGEYSGDGGDALWKTSEPNWLLNGMKFSTHDQDNDNSSRHCALTYRGAWWFNNCHEAHLNGYPYIGKHDSFGDGINWDTFKGDHYSLKKVSMKIRPLPTKAKNCAEIKSKGDSTSGVRTVNPYGDVNSRSVEVYCDQTSDGGGWTVFQSRSPLPTRENFSRSWNEYVVGFGDVNGEFWLGLENIHALTNSAQMELRIDLEDWEGEKRWAKYRIFRVGDAASKFVLAIGEYSGDAGDGMPPINRDAGDPNGMKFSTYDQDNDLLQGNCAKEFHGGWWFNHCHFSHLNGYPYEGKHESYADGINWYTFHGYQYSLKKVSMKIRPK